MNYIFKKLFDKESKRLVMELCDDAYTISVTGRSDYENLFEKIHNKAIMIAIFRDSDTDLCGYSAFYANDTENRRAYISLFCIRKEMQRKYAGTRLMEETINIARRNGMERIALEVLKQDTGAITFYSRMGFEKICTCWNFGESEKFIRMERAL